MVTRKHHGDGAQAAFYADPRVLTISLHESPASLFPGTGRPSETGAPTAVGSAVKPLLRAFRPQVLVSQHGCDTHWLDPLANRN